jgi:hypothetical protein
MRLTKIWWRCRSLLAGTRQQASTATTENPFELKIQRLLDSS